MRELFDAQREVLISLRTAADLDEVMRWVERELDLEESWPGS